MGSGTARGDAGPRARHSPRLDLRPAGRRRASRLRRPAECGQVVFASGSLTDPDQDRRLRIHHDEAGRSAHAAARRARPTGRDPGPDRGCGGGSRRRTGVARRSTRRRRRRALPRRLTSARARGDSRRARAGGDRVADAPRRDEGRRVARAVRLDRRLDPRRDEPGCAPRRDLGADRPHPSLSPPSGRGRLGSVPASPARHGGRRCARHSQ